MENGISINELKLMEKGNIVIHVGENNIIKRISNLVSYDKSEQYHFIYNSIDIFKNIEHHIKTIYPDFKEFQFTNKKSHFTILNVLYVDKNDNKTSLEIKNTGFLNIITQLTILENAYKNDIICLNYIEHGLLPGQIDFLLNIINEYVKNKNLLCFIQTCNQTVLKRKYYHVLYTKNDIIYLYPIMCNL